MDDWLLVRGVIIGFGIAAPVGPIGLLCMRRTLSEGRVAGFVSGLGAATADALYGCVAGFGLTFVTALLVQHATWLRFGGGLVLCYLGFTTFVARPAARAADAGRGGLAWAYGSTLVLTLANPLTIISFAAIFAGLGVAETRSYGAALLLVAGVFGGLALWWLGLTAFVGLARARITARSLRWINRAAGVLLLSFGLATILSLW